MADAVTPTLDDTAEELLDMSDDEFRQLVVDESRGEARWATETLTTDLTCCERWVEALKGISQANLDRLSELRREIEDCRDPEERRELKNKRRNTNWFREKMDQRLREAKACQTEMHREHYSTTEATKRKGWWPVMVAVAEGGPTLWSHLGLDDRAIEVLEGIRAELA